MNSEAVLQAIEPNSASSTLEVSDLGISQSSVVNHLHNLGKSILINQIVLHITKILQNLTYLSELRITYLCPDGQNHFLTNIFPKLGHLIIKDFVINFSSTSIFFVRDANGIVTIIAGSGLGYLSSNPDEAVCIPHNANIFGKGMNPIILLPALGK